MDREVFQSRQKATGQSHPIYSWKGVVDCRFLLPVIGDAILIVLGLMKANLYIVALSMTFGKLARYALLVAATIGAFKFFHF